MPPRNRCSTSTPSIVVDFNRGIDSKELREQERREHVLIWITEPVRLFTSILSETAH